MTGLSDLTRAIGEAVVQGDLDGALRLLEERHKAFQRIDWSLEAFQEFENELVSLRAMDQGLLDFCQSWHEALRKQLETLNAGRLVQQCYGERGRAAKFVDVRK